MISPKNTLERGQSLTYNKILYYRCISILKLMYRYFIKNIVHHPSISIRLEKIRFAYRFHLPFGKFLVSHLFSPALFICINDAPCFLQKIFQQNGSFLNIKIQSLKQKTCNSNKGGCWQKKFFNWASQNDIAMFTKLLKQLLSVKHFCRLLSTTFCVIV